jgi:hypothetical protein
MVRAFTEPGQGDVLLGAEVHGDGARGDFGPLGYVGDGRGVVAPLGEQFEGGTGDRRSAPGLAAFS